MLKSLSISNFALIEQVTLEFGIGLTVLTGETGAGKSILIDALNVLLGGRASVEAIRTGFDFFRVEGVFDIGNSPNIMRLLEEHDIMQEEDNLIISRRLAKNGKNAIVVNGCHVPLSVLKKFGELLIDMHGQHDNQALLRPESAAVILDSYDARIGECIVSYRSLYQQWQKVKEDLTRIIHTSREREQRIDMLSWQTQEIAAAALKPGEEERLETEVRILANAEKISRSAERAHVLFHHGTKGNAGLLGTLVEIRKELETIGRYDNSINNALKIVQDAWYQLDEAASEVSNYNEAVEYDPKRLTKLQDRLDVIYKLKKKYGASVEEVLVYYQQAADELSSITSSDEIIANLENKKTSLEAELHQHCQQLDSFRREAGDRLATQICQHLVDLAIPKAQLVFRIEQTAEFGPQGNNQISLLFSANPGEDLRPLHKIASGGELSRLALAIKSVSSGGSSAGIMVFDEVDAGIGGQTAQKVAEKVAMAALDKQVLVITHLPQMACMADGHYHVAKHTGEGRTYTTVRLLTAQDRIREITRMMNGENLTAVALENTEQLLVAVKKKKDMWKNNAQA